METTSLWQIGEDVWECNSCGYLLITDSPEKYDKCPGCGIEIFGVVKNVTAQFIKWGENDD